MREEKWLRNRRNSGLLVVGLLALMAGGSAFAAEGYVGPVYLDSVGVQQIPGVTAHRPGNLEIKIRDGFTVPKGVNCESVYITTRKENDSDKRMFALLTAGHLAGRPVKLQISDDPALQAFPGRCSLLWVEVMP